MSTAATNLGKALGTAATTGNLLVGVFGGIAAVVAGAFLIDLAKAKARTDEFNGIMDDLRTTTTNLSTEFRTGKSTAEDYFEAYENGVESYNDWTQKMQQHNDTIADTRDEVGNSVAMLQVYKDIIDEAAGKGEEYEGSQLKLKWAVEQLNAELGTSYDWEEVLKGKRDEESGAVQNLRGEIDQLIETRKRELRLQGFEKIFSETSAAAAETALAYQEAKDAYDEYIDGYIKSAREITTAMPMLMPGLAGYTPMPSLSRWQKLRARVRNSMTK